MSLRPELDFVDEQVCANVIVVRELVHRAGLAWSGCTGRRRFSGHDRKGDDADEGGEDVTADEGFS